MTEYSVVMADRRSKTKHVKKQQINDKKLEEDLLKQYEELKLETTDPKPARITLSLIAKRNLPATLANGPQDNLIESLAKISHVRLDRENIKHIDNLEMLGPVTNVYLQRNVIERIENLESLSHLRFLVLSANRIQEVENLHSLQMLKFLDVSDNLISHLHIDELPPSLMVLNLSGNQCTKECNYRKNVIKSLPNLQQLDNHQISKQEKIKIGIEVSSSSEEDEDEVEDDYYGNHLRYNQQVLDKADDFFSTSSQIMQRSKDRMKVYCSKHDAVLNELDNFRSQSELAMSTARSDNSAANQGLA